MTSRSRSGRALVLARARHRRNGDRRLLGDRNIPHASTCAFSVSPATASVSGSGGTVAITVTTGSACSWTATSNAAFVTVSAGASGTGNGTVTATVAAGTGAARSGTLTIAGQTVTINQSATSGISASFVLFDPGLSTSPTTECRITSGIATTCTLAVVFDSARHERPRLLLVDRAVDRRHRPDAHPGWREHHVLLHVDLRRARQHG